MARRSISYEELVSRLIYDETTGIFTWLDSRKYDIPTGSIAGCLRKGARSNYMFIKLNGKDYQVHRLAWMYKYGSFPELEIDHINGNSTDNRLVNLRLANRFENMQNRKLSIHNTSGFKGVSWHKGENKWLSRITSKGIRYCLGYFDILDDAIIAYKKAAVKLHGKFYRELT